MKKFDYITALRWGLPILAILFVFLCRYQPAWAEGYARMVYPFLSIALSAFSSLFPFSLEEVLVVVCHSLDSSIPSSAKKKREIMEIHRRA